MRWRVAPDHIELGEWSGMRRRSKRRQSSRGSTTWDSTTLWPTTWRWSRRASTRRPGKDLHVLRGLAGTTCKVFFSDDELMLTLGTGRPGMKVLDVSDEWVRIEYERASGVGKRQTVVQLVDVNAIESFVIAGDAS